MIQRSEIMLMVIKILNKKKNLAFIYKPFSKYNDVNTASTDVILYYLTTNRNATLS